MIIDKNYSATGLYYRMSFQNWINQNKVDKARDNLENSFVNKCTAKELIF